MGNNIQGVHNFLDISTGHLPAKDRELLAKRTSERYSLEGPRAVGHGHGWFVHVPLDDQKLHFGNYRRAGFSEIGIH